MKNQAALAENRDVVVFHILKSMPYPRRLGLSFLLILSGMVVQAAMMTLFPGCAFVLLGSLLLVVRGYDNRVRPGKFAPEAAWEKVDRSKFGEVERLHRDMQRWDRSLLDVTNKLGLGVFALLAGIIGIFLMHGMETGNPVLVILAGNGALLLFPHWFTGIRSILTHPLMVLKIETFHRVLNSKKHPLPPDVEVEYYMLMKGDAAKIPDDVKIRMRLKNQPADFMGLYGQVAGNTVNGKTYPYFYVVLVARAGFGLDRLAEAGAPPKKITREFSVENDVEVLVVRQTTTRTSGYHTKDKPAGLILKEGLELARRTAALKNQSLS